MIQAPKLYETAFIINASLDDPVIDGIIDKVKDVIVKNGGEIVDIAKWGRKRFAFPIKKKNNGFYVVCEFKAKRSFNARSRRISGRSRTSCCTCSRHIRKKLNRTKGK